MRNCPVCNSDKRIDIWNMDYIVPDNWELPTHNEICLCTCGMIYYNNDRIQEDYDKYYKNRYGTDGTLTDVVNYARLDELVQLVIQTEPNHYACIVDFGGGNGYIKRQLIGLGYDNVHTIDVGDKLPKDIDLLIASHVLEHIYDVHKIMNTLVFHTRGKILIDLPDAIGMSTITTLPMLDYHQKHINHFSIKTLNNLLSQYDYSPIYINHYLIKSNNYPSFRVVYERQNEALSYGKSQGRVESNINEKLKILNEITFPVIVWGCGDICLHLLTKVKLNIVHFVDNDPAWKGQTIMGIPVLDHVESGVPILVMAQHLRVGVLKKIFDADLANKVILL
jgi:phospholipid N-methyltransferase